MWKSAKNYFGACTEDYIATKCGMAKVKIMLYHCYVILLRFDNFFLSEEDIFI